MQLEPASAGQHLLAQPLGPARVALGKKTKVDRQSLGGLQHPAYVPGPGRAGGRVGARRGARATAHHGGYAAGNRVVYLLRADKVYVDVESAGCQYLALAGYGLRGRADDYVDAWLHLRVASLAYRRDASIAYADVGLHNAPVVEDERVGDHGVDRALGPGSLRLSHAVAYDLAAAEFYFLTVGGAVFLHLDDQLGIGQPHAVANRGAVHVGVSPSRNLARHVSRLPRRHCHGSPAAP